MQHTIATLKYDTAKQLLTGMIPGRQPTDLPLHVRMYASSGGSRGHKAVTARLAKAYLHDQADSFTSRLSTTAERKDSKGNYLARGGTLPAGHYSCVYMGDHPVFHECIRLLRQKDAAAIYSPFASMPFAHGRTDSFFIHGHGPKGSDGCIVPASDIERTALNKAIKNFAGRVVLNVVGMSYMLPAERFDGLSA